ncbi:MAG TPA: cytochrome c [Stellaceae bacterium]
MKSALALLASLVLVLVACDNMANQPKRLPFEANRGQEGGPAHRLPPAGTVARDDVPAPQPPVTSALLARGQQRFNIYCAPCHDRVGDGNGMIVQRGFPRPPSYHIDRLRQAPSQHFYDVITNGYGAMYSYAARVAPADRWAIVAYIRALQASQDATLAQVPENERSALQ